VKPVAAGPAASARSPDAGDALVLPLLLAALCLWIAPLLVEWIEGAWLYGRQELLILAVSAWLVWRRRAELAQLPYVERAPGAAALLGVGLVLYLVGMVTDVRAAVVLSLIAVIAGAVWQFKGLRALRHVAFALAYLLFAFPLPYEVVLWLTGPLKEAVSAVSTYILSAAGFSAGHAGVLITVGQYQLLVAEACAGLQTVFTLEAMGLLYVNLVNHSSAARNVLLAIVVVPIGFIANVIRVVALALVTYYFGDAAGQSFLHGFAGIVLFVVALALIAGVDNAFERLWPRKAPA
jgi:exosortase B